MRYLRAVLYFLSTVVMYLGFPLLGWGLGDLQGFFSLCPRSGYALMVVAFGLAVAYQALGGSEGIRGGKGEERSLVQRQSIVRYAMSVLLFGALILLPFADRRGLGVMIVGQAMRWLGLFLASMGYALVFWSGLALGKQYSPEVTLQKGHQLVTTGPYHSVRHPRYLGVILLTFGTSLVFRSWIGLVGSVPLVAILLFRIRDEEALLHGEFGPEWEAYCARSWHLIPHLY